MRDKVFISYSHKDKEWLDRLHVHLKPLMRDQKIDIWDDTRITPGAKWHDEIKNGLQSAKVAVLLISPDFLASDFIVKEELPALLDASDKWGVKVLGVMLGPANLSIFPKLTQFQMVNDLKKPLIGLEKVEQEEILVELSRAIASAIEKAIDDKNIIAKNGDGTKIWFSDFLHPDPVAVKLAVIAFQNGERNFKVEWHEENRQHYETLKDLFEQAKNYRNGNSAFCNIENDIVMKFIQMASNNVFDYQEKTSKVEKRIPILLEGMKDFYSLKDEGERALANYLALCSLYIYLDILKCFRWKIIYKKYFPAKWESFYNAQMDDNNDLGLLFDVDEKFYLGRLERISGVAVEEYFPHTYYIYVGGPKSKMVDACYYYEHKKMHHDFPEGHLYENRWSHYVMGELEYKYLIPQIEWELAQLDSKVIVPYKGDVGIYLVLGKHPNGSDFDLNIYSEWLFLHDQKRYYSKRNMGLQGSQGSLAEDDKLTDEEVKEIYGSREIRDADDE